MSWIETTTEIGIPDSPPLPNVLNSNEKTLTIEIPPLINENGPISFVQVVVVLVDSELSQKFDETLLKSYTEAKDDGTSYYITAQLPYEVLSFYAEFLKLFISINLNVYFCFRIPRQNLL